MSVAMMDVGIVRMAVSQFRVMMDVGMRFARRIGWFVTMLVVLVVGVQMLVRHRLMAVRVSVALGEMKPYANSHEATRHPEQRRWLLGQDN
jgi:bacteriorhodopsin